MTIEIESLSKRYGDKVAVNNVSLSIGKGIFGLIGRNGAGKTTLLRILATLLPKSGGEVSINGIPIRKVKKIRRIIGYMPQEFSFYPGLSVRDTMKYFCALSDISEKYDKRIIEVLSKVHLLDQIETRVHHLSGGMKRRLGMAVAMIANPSILLIDEPTVGLDPEERIHFRRMISEFAEDKIVLLSSHIIEDIEQMCDKIAIMQEGAIVWTGLTNEAKKEMEGMVWEGYSNLEFMEEYRGVPHPSNP